MCSDAHSITLNKEADRNLFAFTHFYVVVFWEPCEFGLVLSSQPRSLNKEVDRNPSAFTPFYVWVFVNLVNLGMVLSSQPKGSSV